MTALTLQNIAKRYGEAQALHGVDLAIDSGEFIVFVGPSGCGKSTLLRVIAGLEAATAGELKFDGEEVSHLTPPQRGIAMVFQSYALYPHMTVFANMAFGMKLARANRDAARAKVMRAAEILQLTPYLERLPKQLSGGQRQRVAIGRAIVRDPRVFLFDEPLSNLDAALRVQTRIEIAKLHERMPATTMIYVTHDQVEAMTLADRIVVLRDGRVEQVGKPMDLYHRPANLFVATFIGSPAMNVLPVTIADGALTPTGGLPVKLDGIDGAGVATLGIRPEDLNLDHGVALFKLPVARIEHLGETQLAYFDLGDAFLTAKFPGHMQLTRGDALTLKCPPTALHLFRPDGAAIARASSRHAGR